MYTAISTTAVTFENRFLFITDTLFLHFVFSTTHLISSQMAVCDDYVYANPQGAIVTNATPSTLSHPILQQEGLQTAKLLT